jgi:transcriptional regulator with XRE-family HTH domain
MNELGKNIAQLRKVQKIKSSELAEMAGIKQPYISAIENGKKIPSLPVLQKIAKALGTTTSELLGEVPYQLPFDMKRLVNTAMHLKREQVDALISMVREFSEQYRDEKPDKK